MHILVANQHYLKLLNKCGTLVVLFMYVCTMYYQNYNYLPVKL